MKKLVSLVLALCLLCAIALAEGVGEEVDPGTCLRYDSSIGIAILKTPDSIARAEDYFYADINEVNADLGAVSFLDGIAFLKPGTDKTNFGMEDVEALVITALCAVGMEGDITEETARLLLADSLQEGDELIEITRADGHNAWLLPCQTLAYGDSLGEKHLEKLEAYRDVHREFFANFVNVPIVKPAQVGDTLSFTCTDLAGHTVDSAELFARAEVTLLNIWTTWCHFCIEEMPELQKLNDETPGVQVVLLCYDVNSLQAEELQTAKDILAEKGVSLTCLIGSAEIMGRLPAEEGYPTSYLADAEGKVLCEPVCGARDCDGYMSWIGGVRE